VHKKISQNLMTLLSRKLDNDPASTSRLRAQRNSDRKAGTRNRRSRGFKLSINRGGPVMLRFICLNQCVIQSPNLQLALLSATRHYCHTASFFISRAQGVARVATLLGATLLGANMHVAIAALTYITGGDLASSNTTSPISR